MFMNSEALREKVKSLPHNPGVYRFYNAAGQIIYVGKAKDLFNRVGQYFQKYLRDGKTRQLVENIASLRYIEVFSELEALILEADLIRKYRPKYNIALKDDKSYLYIVIRNEGEFKKVITARRTDIQKSDIKFGPFPDGYTAKYIIRAIRRIFPHRDCSEGKYAKYKKLETPCLYGHIGLCPGPCAYPEKAEEYNRNILHIKQFLQGHQKNIVNSLKREMSTYSKNMEYEEADRIKRMLRRFEYVQQSFRAPKEFIENPYLVDDIYETALKELMESLPHLNELPRRIECYDVANIMGKDAAVSMVVATNGRLDKREYRKFKIKLKDTPDDFYMLKEALTRRFFHETKENLASWGRPDLVVVDGGKGQVGIALEVLNSLDLNIPVIGLAKREELIVYYSDNEYHELKLERSSEAIKLLQRLRDESHRFARAYHHLLRSRNINA